MEHYTFPNSAISAADGPYSHAAVAGDFVFLAGQTARDAATGKHIAGDIRAQTARSERELRALPAVLTGALAAMLAVWLGVGLAGAALVAQGRLTLSHPDELTPAVMRLLGPWAVLLAGVAVLAALMSTTASFLNLAAAAITRDLPAALGRHAGSVGAARVATLGVAVAAVALGVGSDRTVALLGVAGWGFFTAALLPAFALGLAWPGATGRGVVAALVAGAAIDL